MSDRRITYNRHGCFTLHHRLALLLVGLISLIAGLVIGHFS